MANFFIKKATTGKVIGPLSGRQVKKFCFQTRIKGRDFISTDLKNWRLVSDIPDLYSEEEGEEHSFELQQKIIHDSPNPKRKLKGHDYWNKRPKRRRSNAGNQSNLYSSIAIVLLLGIIAGIVIYFNREADKPNHERFKDSETAQSSESKESKETETKVAEHTKPEKKDNTPEVPESQIKKEPPAEPKFVDPKPEETETVVQKPTVLDEAPKPVIVDKKPEVEATQPKKEETKPPAKKAHPLDRLDAKKLTLLAHAIIDGKVNDVKKLISEGADPNLKSGEENYAPIVWAFKKENRAIVHQLLIHGIDTSASDELGNTVVHWSAEHDDIDTLNYCIRKNSPLDYLNLKNQSPLHLSLNAKAERTTQKLFEKQVKVNIIDKAGNNELSLCATQGDLINTHKLLNLKVEINHANNKGLSALDLAKKSKNQKLIDLLVGQKALSGKDYYNKIYQGDLNSIKEILNKAPQFAKSMSNRSTSFQRVLTSRNKKETKELLALILQFNNNINMKDTRGNTALHFAAEIQRFDAIKILVNFNADINALNHLGQSPLHRLMNKKGNAAEESIEWLIKQGANVHHRDKQGTSCAEMTIRYDNAPALQILLDSGFDVNSVTTMKNTLLDYSRENDKRLCERLLLRNDAITHEALLKKLKDLSKN